MLVYHTLDKQKMASFYAMPRICFFTILLLLRANSQCLNDCTIAIDPSTDCETSPCTGNSSCYFIYSSFPRALVDLDKLCFGNLAKVHLMAGEHFIEQNIYKEVYGINVSKDIIIQGQNSTVINCGNIDDSNITSLLLFYNSTTVELNSLEFNNCQRPIRFNNINKLMISQCVFRYDCKPYHKFYNKKLHYLDYSIHILCI